MTRSATQTSGDAPLPRARALGPSRRTWLGPVIALAVYAPGAIYVLAVNRWHLTTPVVLLFLCWGAVVALTYHLTRMATAASDPRELEALVTGSRDELEREKRKLVKAIKEVEFDRECGKMSEADATALIATYRVRAIDILKNLEQLDVDRAGSPRARVEADLKARVLLEQRTATGKGRARGEQGAAPGAPPSAGTDGGDA